ncbi:methyl-accepting chemotaxis protein [Desulfosporosinus acidiphilus SJ4]|uniref:Methyl-accepting chemotaxis protein n=1 Tax=Desulfosporosinus acidiphilus (strain DSM 22704 / JCM 16185 / SJ4) TaxID=646529 RepID=I4D441_DESAJ|nr:methyl-accepting chemotaxis protein [Desulfosporosinus acidiphilus]AFM40565.1 methyl-accepting chemotaxis protein [Desulfosporosinus acidiphilus SJ4]
MMKIRFANSIGGRLILWFLVFSLVPLLGISTLNYYTTKNDMTQDAIHNMNQTVDLTAEVLNNWLSEKMDVLSTLGKNPVFATGDKAQIADYLKREYPALPYAEDLLWADQNGQAINSSGKTLNISDRGYFKTAIKGEPTISTMLVSKSTGNNIIPIAIPITGTQGPCVLMMSLKGDAIQTILNKAKFGQTGYTYLFDNTGLVIAHPEKSQVLKLNVVKSDSESLNKIGSEMLKNKQGNGEYVFQNIDKEVAYTTVPNTGWHLVITAPIIEFYSFATKLFYMSLGVGLGVALLVAILAWFISKRIAGPIVTLAEQTDVLATGQLNVKINDGYMGELGTLGRSLKIMTENLRNIVSEVHQSSREILTSAQELKNATEESSSSVEQVARATEEMAGGASNQAESSQQIVQMVNQIASAVDHVNVMINKTVEDTNLAKVSVDEGMEAVANQNQKMRENSEAGQQVAVAIEHLLNQAKEVGAILSTISNIAEQTNLLALNAAIEAARAGEHGKGFAVVADEVRKLAEGSRDATEEIAKILGGIQSRAQEAWEQTNKAKAVIEAQEQAVEHTNSSFAKISEIVKSMGEQMQKVKTSSVEIGEHVNEISGSIETIASVAQENAAGAEEVSASTEELSATTEQMAAAARTLSQLGEKLDKDVAIFTL